jgi:hypothetical protein
LVVLHDQGHPNRHIIQPKRINPKPRFLKTGDPTRNQAGGEEEQKIYLTFHYKNKKNTILRSRMSNRFLRALYPFTLTGDPVQAEPGGVRPMSEVS